MSCKCHYCGRELDPLERGLEVCVDVYARGRYARNNTRIFRLCDDCNSATVGEAFREHIESFFPHYPDADAYEKEAR